MKDSESVTVRRPAGRRPQRRYNIQHLSDLSKHFPLSCKRAGAFRRSISTLLIFLLAPVLLQGALGDSPPGSRWLAMGGAGVASPHLREAWAQNPAALPLAPAWHAGSSAGRPFGVAELTSWQCGGGLTRRNWGLALAVSGQGCDLYRETTAAIALGRLFTPGAAFGIALRRAGIAIARYGSASALLCDLGGQTRISSGLRAGFFLRNVFAAAIGRCREELPLSLQSGFELLLSPSTSLCADLYIEKGLPLELRCGAEEQLGEHLALRAGFSSAGWRLAAGFALRFPNLSAEYGTMTHPRLGLSHQCSLVFFPRRP